MKRIQVLLLVFFVLLELIETNEFEVQNPNFTPMKYHGPGFYESMDVYPWIVFFKVSPHPHRQAKLYISNWKAEHLFIAKDTTLLKMAYDRSVTYLQGLSSKKGLYSLSALCFLKKQKDNLFLKIQICGKPEKIHIPSGMKHPTTITFFNFEITQERQCFLKFFEEKLSNEFEKIELLLSNIKITEIQEAQQYVPLLVIQ